MPQNILTITRSADVDLSAKQHFLMKATATGVDLNATLNGPVLGVLTNDPVAGKGAAVQVAGVARVVAGAAFVATLRMPSTVTSPGSSLVAGATALPAWK